MDQGRKIGQYELRGPLGKGGMASVYRAYQPTLDREVAIKIIAEQYANDPTFAERFRREARSIARLHHPNILTIYDFGEDGNLLYIVMEMIDGPTLKDEINGQAMPVDKAIEYVRQVASALDYANKNGIIHRDVKPSNVLIEKNGRAVLSDFGIAKMAEQNTQLTSAGSGIGTPDYMSPEQALGEELDSRSDQYSLGVMLYELLTGRTPFTGDTPVAVVMGHVSKPLPPATSLNPQIPASVEKVLEKSLAKKATDRYDSNAIFAQALEEAWRNRNETPAPTPASVPTATTPNYNPGVTTAAPRPGSGPYIPEAEQLYAEARRQEAQNNFVAAFSTFTQLDGRFPRYRDVPTILERYRTMGYGQQLTGGWANASGPSNVSNQYTPTGYQNQYTGGTGYYGTNPGVPKAKRGAPVVPIFIGVVVLLVIVIVGGILLVSGKKDNPTPVASATQSPNNPAVTTAAATSAATTSAATTAAVNNPTATAEPQATDTPAAKPTDVPPTPEIPTPDAKATPQPGDINPTYKAYGAPQGVWTAEVPDSWKAQEADTEVNFTPSDNSGAGIVVVSEDMGGAGLDQNTINLVLQSYVESAGGSISKTESRKVDGQDGTLSTGTLTTNGIKFNMQLISFVKGDKLFLLMYIATPAQGTTFDPIFSHFLDTFNAA